jgi:LPXTG-site transpeptidase (sortase) family protein
MILFIPRLWLIAVVVAVPLAARQYDMSAVGPGQAGHLAGTIEPGADWGRVVIVGHSDDAFRRLHELQVGDYIQITQEGAAYWYRVNALYITEDDAWQWTQPTWEHQLILITCIGAGRGRLVVVALPVDK